MLVVLGCLLAAVARTREVAEAVATAPTTVRRGTALVLGLFLLGQIWGVSAETYPVATWTMYSYSPGTEATVYTFDAFDAEGDRIEFTPSASHPTVAAKMGLVHLRNLTRVVHDATESGDDAVAASARDRLEQVLLTYVDFHNELSDGPEPVRVEASRVVYDLHADDLTIDSGTRSLVLEVTVPADAEAGAAS